MRQCVRISILLLVFTYILFCHLLPFKAEGASFAFPENARFSHSPQNETDGSVGDNTSPVPDTNTLTPEELAALRQISSPEDWNRLAALVNTGVIDTAGKEFSLTADLDFGSPKIKLIPLGTQQYPFAGRFQGDGHRIYGITSVASHSETASLFGYTKDAVIADVGVETADTGLTGNFNAGFISVAEGHTKIRSSYFSGILSGTVVGGFVADVRGHLSLSDCYAVTMLQRTEREASKPSGAKQGILVGTLSGTEKSAVSAKTSYGLSPDLSIGELFGLSVSPNNLTVSSTFLFDIRSDELLLQINAKSLEWFDFEDVWKQPHPDLFPILLWQKEMSATHPVFSYTVGEDSPVSITPDQPTITINSGDPAVSLSATQRNDLPVYSNFARDKSGQYTAELTTLDEETHAVFLTLKNGQLTASDFSFLRTDSNTLSGAIQGLKNGEPYTVSLESNDRPNSRFSETFLSDTGNKNVFVMTKIPEGIYRLSVTAPGYLEEARGSVAVNGGSVTEPTILIYRAIESVSLEHVPQKRVEPLSTNRISVALTPKDAPVSLLKTDVLLSGVAAPETSYTLDVQENDLFFTPERSGEFTVRVHIYDAHGDAHRTEFVINAYRKVTDLSLLQSVEIASMEKPLEITTKIQPADATETKLDWTILSGSDCLSLEPSGLTCKLIPHKVGTANIQVKSIDEITRTVRVRVLDKTPPTFSQPTFEKTTAIDRTMVCFSVRDDCGVARVMVTKRTGEAVSVSGVWSTPDGYAFEAEPGIEYIVTALDINGNLSEATMMSAELVPANSLINSGLAVSKSADSISLWVGANDLVSPNYVWEKKTASNDWAPISGGVSKMVESGLLPNTWYEYRVIVQDEAGKEVTKTSAVRTNSVSIQPKDIEISAGSSYQGVYVGEQFPVVSLIDGQVDVTGQTSQWIYDDGAMAQESPGSNLFIAKEPGTHVLECIQTDAFGQTAKQTMLLTIQSFDTVSMATDLRLFLMILSMSISLAGLSFLALIRRVQELKARR